ncbi:hypothetical protein NADFUDRAFT_48154 [Nadsonia fulvescens var. elongata DSM 6958]|uniref:Smr domain-containing protein n=1 Tax=Nadsonia fulvescens var. elongata DSM 6958 TaxID=857566 RepID=A0A1E3PD11_9ASCO|nr:hypothetical protein NADFUDRAFT_48154 [Nadsonia fulvescens var. elongata DSM 6958]
MSLDLEVSSTPDLVENSISNRPAEEVSEDFSAEVDFEKRAQALVEEYTLLDSSLVLAIFNDCGHNEVLAREFLDPLRDESMAVKLSMELNQFHSPTLLDDGGDSENNGNNNNESRPRNQDALEREFALIKGELDRLDLIDQYHIDRNPHGGNSNIVYTEEDQVYFADLSAEDADKLRFLHRSFPETSLGILSLKLRLSESGNIDEIIDEVLSIPVLKEEQLNQTLHNSGFTGTVERKKHKKKGKLTTSTTTASTKKKAIKRTVIGLKYNCSNKAGSNYDDFQHYTQLNSIEESTIQPSQWQNFFGDIELLSRILHMDSCQVASAYYRNSVSKIATIVHLTEGIKLSENDHREFSAQSDNKSLDAVLASLEAANERGEGSFDLAEARVRLTQIPQIILERVYKTVEGNTDDLHSVIRILISNENSGSQPHSLNDILIKSTLSGDFFNVLPSKPPAVSSNHSRTTLASSSSQLSSLPSSEFTEVKSNKVVNYNRKTARDLRSLAETHEMSRNRAYTQAVEAHKLAKANKLFGGASSYYAELGSEHDRRRRALLTQAIDKEVHRQEVEDFYKLDLHGYTVAQSLDIVREKLVNWWTKEITSDLVSARSVQSRVRPLTLITGVGYNSEGGVSKIKVATKKLLTNDGWKFTTTKVGFLVTGVNETSIKQL